MNIPHIPRKRPPGYASTNITNEFTDALHSLGATVTTGNVDTRQQGIPYRRLKIIGWETADEVPTTLGGGKYWCKLQLPTVTGIAADSADLDLSTAWTEETRGDGSANWVMLINEQESETSEHGLPKGSYVDGIPDGQTSDAAPYRKYRVSICCPTLLKVTGNASGGGKYTGRTMSLSGTSVAATSNLSEADLGTAGETDVLILNSPEVGQSTHDLTNGTPKSKWFWGRRHPKLSTADLAVYIINGFDIENCT